MPRTPLRSLARLLPIVLVATLAACTSSSSRPKATKACGVVKVEAFDTRSLQHILPNAPVPSYLTDPPTSGPHQPSPPLSGVQTQQVPKPVQVGLLEGGNVLVQYRGLSAADLRSLDALVGAKTVIAPNNDLENGQVVLTSWLHKQTCSSVDTAAVKAFVRSYANHGPDYHPEN